MSDSLTTALLCAVGSAVSSDLSLYYSKRMNGSLVRLTGALLLVFYAWVLFAAAVYFFLIDIGYVTP